MDDRLLILAAALVLVVLSLMSLLVALLRYRRPVEPYEAEPEGNWPMLMPAPSEAYRLNPEEKFAEATSGPASVLHTPLRTGAWRPEPYDASKEPIATTDDYWDALIDEPSLLVRPVHPAATPHRAPVAPVMPTQPPAEPAPAVAAPSTTPSPAPQPPAESTPVVAAPSTTPSPAPQPMPPMVPLVEPVPSRPVIATPSPAMPPEAVAPAAAPAAQGTADHAWIESIIEGLDTETPAPAPTTVQPPVEPEQVSGSEVPPVTDFTPEPPFAQDPLQAELPPAPVLDVTPAYVSPAGSEPVVRPTPEEPSIGAPATAAQVVPSEDESGQGPATPRLSPAEPEPSGPPRAVVHRSEPPPPPPTIPPESPMRRSPRPEVVVMTPAEGGSTRLPSDAEEIPEHLLVAPVEMWFGDHRVGVRKGTRTYELFQRYASVLFDDLKNAQREVPTGR